MPGPYDAALRALHPARDRAPVSLLVQRVAKGERALPTTVTLDPERGVIGDRWALGAAPLLEAQVTLMRWDVATIFRPDPGIFGDNLFVSLDTSEDNLPTGTILGIGQCRLEVQAKPHTGCSKFQVRAGVEALAVTRAPEWLRARLRGVHLRVLTGGRVAVGDTMVVRSRPVMPLTVFGIPSCGTVKKARAWLDAAGIAHTFVDFRAAPPAPAQVAAWVAAFGARALRNTSGGSYRALGPEKDDWGDAQWQDAFRRDPMLIKRPVVERDGRPVVVGWSLPDDELRSRLG